jgi:hypothetical protein
MKTARHPRFWFNATAIAFLAAACTFPVTTSDDIEVHIARPASGDVIMLGESVQFLANGSSSDGDVRRVLFFANGSLVGDEPNAHDEIIVSEIIWTPPAAGEYTLQVAAQRDSEYIYSSTVELCVLPFQIAPGHPVDIYAHGYEGECTIPPRSSSAGTGSPSMRTSVAPTSLTYVPSFYSDCPGETRMMDFKVYVDDPHDDVVFVAIAIQIEPGFASRINSETTVVLTHTVGEAPGTKGFFGQFDVHIFLARSLISRSTGEAVSGELRWTARAFGRDGSILLEHGPQGIPVSPLNCDGTSVLTSASAPILIESTGTATPRSAADCPAGTYYAETTSKCIPIQISTEKPSGDHDGGGSGCSSFGSKDSCTAAGCSWDFNSSSCH